MHGRRTSAGLFAALVGLAGTAVGLPAAQASGTWGPVADLSGSADSIRGAEVAVDPRGGFVAGWVRGDGDRARVVLAARLGASWTRPTPVPGTEGVGEVRLAVAGDGERVVVWTVGHTVKVSRRAPGRPWTDPVVLHRTRSRVLPAYVDLAVNRRGGTVVAWQTLNRDIELRRVRERVQAVVGGAAGRWSRVTTLSSSTAHAASPEVALDHAGRVTVAWTQWGRRHSWVMVASREVGEGWAGRRALSLRTRDTGVPQLAANDAGDVAVAWSVRGEDLTAIRLRRWERGRGWLPTSSVPGVRADIWWMDAGIDGAGTATVTWSNGAHAAWAATQDTGGRWVRARVAPSGSVFYGMNVAVNEAGDTLVGWESRIGGDHPVRVAHRPRGSGWERQVALSVVPGDAFGPALALDRDGDAVAAWTFARDISRPFRVQARVLDAG